MAKPKRKTNRTKSKTLKNQKFSLRQMGFFALIFAVVGAAVVWQTFAAGPTACTPANPTISADNNYAWAQWGSWGTPAQQLTYMAHVSNYDIGCAASTFTINASAPDGFLVSVPVNTITLKAAGIGYLKVYVTSPNAVADGDYPINLTINRAGTSNTSGSGVNYYKVYSSDTTPPVLYWSYPGEGEVLGGKGKAGRTSSLSVESNDNHAVKKIEIYLDDALVSTTQCDDIAYACQGYYSWSLRGQTGSHTASFKSYDWFGNVGTLTNHFSVL